MQALFGARLALMIGMIAAPAALNAQAAASNPPAAEKGKDMNEIVCEKQKVPGSRLASAKVCHTRAEWAELRRQDRMEIDRAQTQRGVSDK